MGILNDDRRMQAIYDKFLELQETDHIMLEHFEEMVKNNVSLNKILMGELILPEFEKFTDSIKKSTKNVKIMFRDMLQTIYLNLNE